MDWSGALGFRGADGHAQVWEWVRHSRLHPRMARLANLGERLKVLRNRADYRMDISVTGAEAEDAEIKARQAHEILDAIQSATGH